MAQTQLISNSRPTSLSPPTSPTISEHSTFTPHFVQALHDYLPSTTNTEESVSCLYFQKGSIIEVFNRDDSGWWDGQCGDVRGWFPSNYVGKIGDLKRSSTDFENGYSASHELEAWHQKMGYQFNNSSTMSLGDSSAKINSIQNRVEIARALLREDRRKSEGLSDNIDLPSMIDGVDKRVASLIDACHSQQTDNIQLLNSRIVSSVRSVLSELNIMHKESNLLKLYPESARQRKIILNSLNNLVLKSKEFSQLEQVSEEDKDQIAILGDNLINEMDIFEKIMLSIPRQSISNSTDRTSISSIFNTPRSSVSSLGYSATSTSTTSLRSTLLSNQSSIKNQVATLDQGDILQIIMDYQKCIDKLVNDLNALLEGYLGSRQHVTEILEITRKAMESVMSFLAVVEQVCSNISDLDYSRRISMIPEDPLLVELVISKESVYSAITNLVTAVRVITGHCSTDSNTNLLKEDYNHLRSCCEGVTKTTNECAGCLRTFLLLEREEHYVDEHILMRDVQEKNISNEKHDLNTLERKLNTLTMIQQCLAEQEHKPVTEDVVESLTVVTKDIPEKRLSSSSSISSMPIANDATAVETIIPETNPVKQTKMRPRAASVNSTPFPTLPPLPSVKDGVQLKSSVSTTHIGSQDFAKPTPQRRSRGLSVSSLRSSIGKSKTDRISTSQSAENLSEPPKIHKLPSWMSIHSSVDKQERNQPTLEVSSPLLQLAKKETDYPFLNQPAFTEDEILLNAEGEVTGGTIEALVRKLTLHEKSPDLIFTRAFFYNFRLFTNPAEFVRLLIDRFTLQPPDSLPEDHLPVWTNRVLIPIRLRVYNVIKTWLETYFNFEQDGHVEETLSNFASNEMSKVMPGPAQRMIELISRTFNSKGKNHTGRKSAFNESRIVMQRSTSTSIQSSVTSNTNLFSNLLFDDHTDEKYPQPILGKSLRNTLKRNISQQIHINDIDPVELARQLTLMENCLFCQIRANELIGQEFKKKVGTSQAVHVKAMIQKSTQITSWVSETILNEVDVKKRANVLKYWIKVGDTCLQLNNYNTLMAIRSALDSTSINRLKKTWEYLSVKYKSMWEPIYRATDSQRNFAEYRQRLKTTIAPCLPFLGVYLTDLTFIDDGNSDYRTSVSGQQLINFDKYVKITRILNEIDQFQLSYKLMEVEEIQTYLKNTLETIEQDDQVYYARSLQREPKDEETVDK